MLVLVISQTDTSIFLIFNFILLITPGVTRINRLLFSNWLGFWKSWKMEDLRFLSALVEARAGLGIGSWILSKLEHDRVLFIDVRECTGPLFTSGLLHIFTQLKVGKVCLTEWTLDLIMKFYLSHSKMLTRR